MLLVTFAGPQVLEGQWIIAPGGIITPTHVLNRTTNAVTHLQFLLYAIIFEKLRPNILMWLENVLLYVPSEEELLTSS